MIKTTLISAVILVALLIGVAFGLSPYVMYSHFAADFQSDTAGFLCLLGVMFGIVVTFFSAIALTWLLEALGLDIRG